MLCEFSWQLKRTKPSKIFIAVANVGFWLIFLRCLPTDLTTNWHAVDNPGPTLDCCSLQALGCNEETLGCRASSLGGICEPPERLPGWRCRRSLRQTKRRVVFFFTNYRKLSNPRHTLLPGFLFNLLRFFPWCPPAYLFSALLFVYTSYPSSFLCVCVCETYCVNPHWLFTRQCEWLSTRRMTPLLCSLLLNSWFGKCKDTFL